MTTLYGLVRVIAPDADAGRPVPGHLMPETQLVFPISEDETALGSGLHNAIVLFDPSVAPEHACIHYNQGAWAIENMSETQPLWVEETEVPPNMLASVAAGQYIQLGAVRLQLVTSDLPMRLMALGDEVPNASRATNATLLQGTWRRPTGIGDRLALAVVGVAFVVALVLVIVGLGTLITQRVLSGEGISVLAALVLPLIPAAGIITLIALIDRYEREPWYLLAAAFLWGAIIAIPPAFIIEKGLNLGISALPINLVSHLWGNVAQSALYGLNAGITEEAVKGAGLLALLFMVRDKFQNITDGILFGAVIGAGFAMTENIAYFVNADASRSAVVFLIIGRVILGWLGHSTFTACFGAGLGYMREGRAGFRPWLPPLLGFLAAVFLHSLFDFIDIQANTAVHDAPGSPVVYVLALLAVILGFVPLFGTQFVLVVMLMRSLAREAGILREYLVDEVRQGVVTPEEYLVLQRASVRQRLHRSLLLLRGVQVWLTTRTLYATEVGLAFAKWHASLDSPANSLPLTPPNAYRARIRRLRRTLRDLDKHNEPTATPNYPASYGTRE